MKFQSILPVRFTTSDKLVLTHKQNCNFVDACSETDDGLKKILLLADISLFASTIFVGLLLWRRSRTREEAKVEDATRRISHTNPLSEVEDDEGES